MPSKVTELSEREAEVAQSAANGLTNQEIGTLLGIDPDTVKVHLRSIFRKMGIRRRNHLLKAFPPQRVFSVEKPSAPKDITLLTYMAEGLTDAEISETLKVPMTEVHTDVARLRRETGISSRNELAMWWMVESGMVKQATRPLPETQKRIIEHRTQRTRARSLEPEAVSA